MGVPPPSPITQYTCWLGGYLGDTETHIYPIRYTNDYRTADQEMKDIPLMSSCYNCRIQGSCIHLKRIRKVTPESLTVIIRDCKDYKHTSLEDRMEEENDAN